MSNNAASTYIIMISKELSRIVANLPIWIDEQERIDRLLFQTYIIIIGGSDNLELGGCIDHSSLEVGVQRFWFFLYAMHTSDSTLTIVVKVFVLRLTLTKAHALNISHQQFHLIVGDQSNAVQKFVGILIIHFQYADKSEVVQCFCLACGITISCCQSTFGINRSGIKIAIMIRIGYFVQLVNILCMWRCTSRKQCHR